MSLWSIIVTYLKSQHELCSQKANKPVSLCAHRCLCKCMLCAECYSVSIVTASLKFMGFKSCRCQLRKDECTLFIYSSTIHNKLFQHLSSSCNIAGYIFFFFKLLQHGTLFIYLFSAKWVSVLNLTLLW